MSAERVFHQYEGWPAENSKLTVPRITEARALKLAAGKRMVDERGTSVARYDLREYRDLETGESAWLGGDFTGWQK